MIKIGNSDIKLCWGSSEVQKAYLGEIEIYSIAQPIDKLMKITTKFNGLDTDHCILGSKSYFNYDQLERVVINGVDYDFKNNGRYVYLNAGENTIEYYAYSSKITAMSDMLQGCNDMYSVDFSEWDFSHITTVRSLFNGCSSLTSIEGIENINTSNITDFGYLFNNCTSLTTLDLSNWNFSNANKMDAMFTRCSNLTELTIMSEINLNADYSGGMFSGIYTDGTFYYNPQFDYSPIIAKLPSSWTAVPVYGENAITLTYDITTASDRSVYTLYRDFDYSIFKAMYADGNEVAVARSYTFPTTGEHTIKLVFDDTKEITSFANMFREIQSANRSLKKIDLTSCNSRTVTNFSYMFAYCYGVQEIIGIDSIQTLNAINLNRMFTNCESLTSLDLSRWKVSNVMYMQEMFDGCKSLTDLNISGWDLQNVNSIQELFQNCESLANLNVTDVNVTNISSFSSLFNGCSNLQEINGLSTWNTPNVSNLNSMFNGCTSLQVIDLSNFNLTRVSDYNYMFRGCTSLQRVKMLSNLYNGSSSISVTNMFGSITTNGVFVYNSNFDYTPIINVLPASWSAEQLELDYIQAEYYDAESINVINSQFNASQLELLEVNGVFTSVKPVINNTLTSQTNTVKLYYEKGALTDLSYMFKNTNLYSIDLSEFDAELTNIVSMFYGSNVNTVDVSNLNISNITSLNNLFHNCSNLHTITGLNTWVTTNVTDISYMFRGCGNLTSLDLTNWDTSNVLDMGNLFDGCRSLEVINGLYAFNTSNVINMYATFYGVPFVSFDLRGWDLQNVTNMYALFNDCGNLETIYMDSPLNAELNATEFIGFYTKPDGVFYYNPQYDYTAITSNFDSYGWTAVPITTA